MSNDSMPSYYAQRAAEYERIYAKPERQSDLRELESYISEIFAGRDILEIACGTGYWTQFAAASARSITATDINPEVIAIAKTKLYRTLPKFLIADAYAPSSIPGSFDAVLSAFWWSHVPKQRLDEFLAQLHGCVPSGTLVVFLDNRYVEGSSTPLSYTDEQGNTFQDRGLADGSVHRVLKNFPTAAEIRSTLQGKAADIAVQELQYYWLASYKTL